MTSKAQKKNGWLIPTPITGYPLVCVKLQIPNAREYIAAVTGAIYELTKWWNWEKSYLPGDTRAVQASSYMMESINAMTIDDCCTIQYRYLGCDLLEFSLDGENWQTVADFSDCFVALHPATTARNIITPSQANVVALTIQQFPGSAADIERWYRENGALAAVLDGGGDWVFDGVLYGYSKTVGGRWALRRDINSKIYLDLKGHGGHNEIGFWSGFSGSQMFAMETPYFDPTRLKMFGVGYTLAGMTMRNTGEIGLGTDTPLARLHVKNQGVGEIGQIIQLYAAASASAIEIRKSDGTLVSGFDERGENFLAKYAGQPTHEPDNNFTIVGNSADSSLWWYDGALPWIRAWSDLDGNLITTVTTETADYGDPGSASLDGDTLNIVFPAPNTPQNAPRIYHSVRTRPAPLQSDSVVLALDANGAQALPWTVADGDVIAISEITGWMNDGNAITNPNEGYRGDGTWYYSGDPANNVLGYVSENVPPMSILLLHKSNPGELIVETPALLTGATLANVNPTNPYALFIPNYQIVPNDRFGNVQFRVALTAAAAFGDCGLSDFEAGYSGWTFKPVGEDPIFYYNNTAQLEMGPALYEAGVGFKTIVYYDDVPNNGETAGLIIRMFMENAADINSIDIDYEIIDNDHDFYIHYALFDGTDWTSFNQRSITQGVGTHTDTITLSNNSTQGVAIVLKTLRVAGDTNTSSALISSITINCEA